MPSFALIDQVIKDITLLSDLQDDDVARLCQAACSFIQQEAYRANSEVFKLINAASSELENCICGLSFIYLHIFQTKEDLIGYIKEESKLSESVWLIIKDCYEKHKKTLDSISNTCRVSNVEYRGLQWRLQSTVSSRSQLNSSVVLPRAILRLDLLRAGKPYSIPLVADFPNIQHWNEIIEQALAESRTLNKNTRKIQKILS